MRAEEFVTEVRAGMLNYLKQQFPTWPDYVIQDLLYKNIKGMTKQEEISEYLGYIKQDYGNVRWQLQQLPIRLNVFDPETQKKIQQRSGGTKNPYQVPNDAERHATQADMIKKQGVSREPIIVVKTAQGYELLEGWHRTIQHLQAFPNGYRGPAWIGIPSSAITEVLNTQAHDAKWTQSSDDVSTLEFTTSNGIVYELDFISPDWGPDEIHPVDFLHDIDDDDIDRSVFIEFSQKDATGDAKQGIAGTGAAAEVFGIVTNAILDFVKKRKPAMLYFQAVEPNRRKLYASIVKRLVQSMPGYRAMQLQDKFAIYSSSLDNQQVEENFADGKKKGKSRPGRVKRAGASCKGSVTDLRARAKKYSGERGKMYHWCANMKSGKKKK